MATIKKLVKAGLSGKRNSVPNGPLVKKKGAFKGSTLKKGGSVKKAQDGAKKRSSSTKTVTGGGGNKDYTSMFGDMYNTVVRTNTPQGPRYYSGESPDYNMSQRIAQSSARRQGADSTRRSSLTPGQLEGLGERKRGGKVTKKARTGAWQRKEGKSPSGGLNAKGRASLKAEGHNIKPPQPEGGPRKRSFCARMKGHKRKNTSAKTARDPNSRINLALRKWKC